MDENKRRGSDDSESYGSNFGSSLNYGEEAEESMSSMPLDELESEEFGEVDPNQLALDKEWLDNCI